ncbi:MAG TPA: prenyltransferase/squalene oxidase repeat-containing protein [Chloroflexia bacterium]|nr:prenyltransferase/squalene oxidase repeat-containing protein [Chloroflexia bacterium]
MAIEFTTALQKAYNFLAISQNPDGGWGYRRGGMSYVEPTSFALLALFSQAGAGGQNVADNRYQAVLRGLAWLRSQQHEDGGWGIMKDDSVSGWMTYPATWMLTVLTKIPELVSYYGKPEDNVMLDKARSWILNKGLEGTVDAATDTQVRRLFQIDSSLLGFAWGHGESGWVIPTSLAMVALTVQDPAVFRETKEVKMGKDYLRDRACPDGGWNVGNPWMIGKKLPPTVDATSFALVAWRATIAASDFGPNTDVINAGLTFLDDYITTSNSDHSIALAAWALSLFKEPDDRDDYRLRLANGITQNDAPAERSFTYRGKEIKKRTATGQDKETGGWANSPYTTAIASFALSNDRYYLDPK